jgi:hypothetical protein
VPEGCHQPLDNITEIKVWKRPYKITIGDGICGSNSYFKIFNQGLYKWQER